MSTQEVYHTPPQTSLVLLGLALHRSVPASEAAACCRAVDRMVAYLMADRVRYSFDGVEVRVLSATAPDRDVWYITDGNACTCEAAHHPWCWHRVLHRCLTAAAALVNPLELRSVIVEQCGHVVA